MRCRRNLAVERRASKLTKARPKVAIVHKFITFYRRRFFELLKEQLDMHGVELVLVYGQPRGADAAKEDAVNIAGVHKIENRVFKFRSREAYWQPCLALLRDADLVIVEQASKLLVNYVLLVQQLLGRKQLAFWGHGMNFQAPGGNRASEALKRFVSRQVHWWFAYNDLSARVVEGIGFPAGRITSVQNAIDTKQLIEARHKTAPEVVERLKEQLGLEGKNVCVYAGGMYAEKRLGFLLEACRLARQKVPDFEMIFIGAGVDEGLVEEAAREYDWIHYVGPKFDEEKVPYFMLSKLFLMPGLVGLAVLDAFALETPLVTTAIPYHSPEIDYLEDGVNGVIVKNTNDPAAFASAVVRLLEDEDARMRLIEGCRVSQGRYTVEEMAERFASGILAALGKKS